MKFISLLLAPLIIITASNTSPIENLVQALQQLTGNRPTILKKFVKEADPQTTKAIVENFCWAATIIALKPQFATVADTESAQLLLLYLLTIFPEADPKVIGKKIETLIDPTKDSPFNKTMKLLSEKLATWKEAADNKDAAIDETMTLLAERQPAQLLKDLFIANFKKPLETTVCLKDFNPLLFQEKKLLNQIDATVPASALSAGFYILVERLKLNKTDVPKFFNLLNDLNSCLAPKQDPSSKEAATAIKNLLETLEKNTGWGEKLVKQEEDDKNKVPLDDQLKLLALHDLLNDLYFGKSSTLAATHILKNMHARDIEMFDEITCFALSTLEEFNKTYAEVFTHKSSQKFYQLMMNEFKKQIEQSFTTTKELLLKTSTVVIVNLTHLENWALTLLYAPFIRNLIERTVRSLLDRLHVYVRYFKKINPYGGYKQPPLPPTEEQLAIKGPGGDWLCRSSLIFVEQGAPIPFAEKIPKWMTIGMLQNFIETTFEFLDRRLQVLPPSPAIPLEKKDYSSMFDSFLWGGMASEFYLYDDYSTPEAVQYLFTFVAKEADKLAQKYAKKSYLSKK